jgi:Nitroreductase family
MTRVANPELTAAVRRAAVRATKAPSVHNTQPWQLLLKRDSLEIYADWTRRLRVLDPRGRQLMVSCGCALVNARVAFAASGYGATVDRFPGGVEDNLLARIVPSTQVPHDRALADLDSAIEVRRTNRRQFADEPVPEELIDRLVAAAAAEGAELYPVVRPEHRAATARLSQLADQIENADPAYRAELRAWTSDDLRREDGVPAFAVPHVTGNAEDDLPIRDFDTRGMGWLPSLTRSGPNQCLLLLGTDEDNPMAWLRAGEALERVLLELADRAYAASPLTQVVEVARMNVQLRQELGLRMHPHVLLRAGRAPVTSATRRRKLVEVITDAD